MKVLVIGKGGREHALVWKLAQSPRVTRVLCAPGNAGTAIDGENVPIEADDIDKLARFAKREGVGLTVVGPEDPLALGVVGTFQKEGLRVFGPSKSAARIEASKVFAKQLMRHADVPTAEFRVFDNHMEARKYVQSREYADTVAGRVAGPFDNARVATDDQGVRYIIDGRRKFRIAEAEPMVVKADGLAAGKGVIVCKGAADALDAIDRLMLREEFGRVGRTVIIERRLEGEEVSLLALVAGRAILPLPATQDHKRLNDGDEGPNTGGMGAYCPAPVATPEFLKAVENRVWIPTVHAMKRGRTPFRGLLYAGLMLTQKGPQVLEFNCRFGDPETQPLLMRLKSDLLDLLEAVVDDRLGAVPEPVWDERPAVSVVVASGGYPGKYTTGWKVNGLADAARLPDVQVFHAGTVPDGDAVKTAGGRVLAVTALGDTVAQARHHAYEAVGKIDFPGMHYRRDIAARAVAPR